MEYSSHAGFFQNLVTDTSNYYSIPHYTALTCIATHTHAHKHTHSHIIFLYFRIRTQYLFAYTCMQYAYKYVARCTVDIVLCSSISMHDILSFIDMAAFTNGSTFETPLNDNNFLVTYTYVYIYILLYNV